MSDDLPSPVAALGNSRIYTMTLWADTDTIVETGAVVVERQSDHVLLVYDERRKTHTLPRSRMDDVEALMKSPLHGLETKIGRPCSRLPLPRLSKHYIVPPNKNWDELRATVHYTPSELTTDPFFVSCSTEWHKTDDPWPYGFQVLTFWYGGYIDVDSPEQLSSADALDSQQQQQPYLLLPLQDALERIKDKDGPAYKALYLFDPIYGGRIWTKGGHPSRFGIPALFPHISRAIPA